MAAYNGERYIEESVRSILGQTLENFEFIIVDDGSTDSTFNKLQQIGDPRLRIIRQSNQGQTSALIAGIQHAKGDLIARLDDDDYSLPNRLMSQLKFMEAYPEKLYDDDLREIQNYLFSRFSSLTTDEFFDVAKMIMSGSDDGKKIVSKMVDEIIEELQSQEYEDAMDQYSDDDEDDDGGLSDLLGDLGISLS